MKATLYATMVLGYEIPASLVIQERETRGCHHPEIEGANYCPECGKPMYVYEDLPVWEDDTEVGEFDVVKVPTKNESGYRYFIGHICKTHWSIPELAAYDFTKHRAALRKVLEEVDIDWDKCTFGLHLAAGLGY